VLPGSSHAKIRNPLAVPRPGHSMRASGAETASTSNCKLRRYDELVWGLPMPSFAETSMPANLQALCESDALDRHLPGKHPGCRRPGQPQRASDEPTHALRVANPHARSERTLTS